MLYVQGKLTLMMPLLNYEVNNVVGIGKTCFQSNTRFVSSNMHFRKEQEF